jgi:hypothetical protein
MLADIALQNRQPTLETNANSFEVSLKRISIHEVTPPVVIRGQILTDL